MATARLDRLRFQMMPGALICYLVFTWIPIAISGGLFWLWNTFSGTAITIPIIEMIVFLLVLRQINVFTVSSLFHRSYSHKQFEYIKPVEWLMRRWNWLLLGTGGRAWAMMHRWHHAKADTPEDPHSPTKEGGSLWNITAQSAESYVECIKNENGKYDKYMKGLPDDRFENFVRFFEVRGFWVLALSRVPVVAGVLYLVPGVSLPAAFLALPAVMGSAWYSTVIMVNGLCHLVGYRIWDNEDTSTNLFPIDFFGWGEALHHNHHERQSRANNAHATWEFDPGYWALWFLSKIGIVKNLRP
ncbi:MAG: hypothetical protein GY898_16885 [Proteobacteria bacterium]|nr:hypothetical protein [Pseudomonadota bacterium]